VALGAMIGLTAAGFTNGPNIQSGDCAPP